MAKNYFDRYIWLIDLISRHGYIKFEDISHSWAHSNLNGADSASLKQNELPQRTFFNHLDAIFNTFGIEIKCDRTKGYYIANSDEFEGGGIKEWLLSSLSLNNVLNECRDMKDRILFEKIPSSKRWLQVVVNAMKDGRAIEITYKKFTSDEEKVYITHPYCLKLFKQRWYMLSKTETKKEPRIYALDERMLNISLTKKALKVPAKFNAAEYFSRFFGIIASDAPAQVIRLRADADQANYFDSLPLHESQKKIAETPKYSDYEYLMVPTYDLEQEILRYGPSVEVLSPEGLRNNIMKDIEGMVAKYGMK